MNFPLEPITRDPNPGLARLILHWIYDLTWIVVLLVASVYWVPRCFLDPGFRHMAANRLGFHWPDFRNVLGQKRILVHGVSVGEVKGAQALIQRLREEYPSFEVVVSTTTNTGEEVARSLYPDLCVVRFPVDMAWIVSRFLKRIAPTVVVLIELEIWPNFLRQANRYGVPVCVVNGRITERSYNSYKLFRSLMPQFNRISVFIAQDEAYAERFGLLVGSTERICVCGNIKVDGLRIGRVPQVTELAEKLGLSGKPDVLVAGSTHSPEERLLTEAWRSAVPNSRLILVPRHPERAKDIVSQLGGLGVRAQRWTDLQAGRERPDPARPLVVDTIGELERIYGVADLVFIGGSLIPHGGQNMLEPAAQGRAVIYGPHVRNFYQEAALLEEAGGSRRLSGDSELASVLSELMGNEELRRQMGTAGLAAVEAQKGATRLTLKALAGACFDRL